MKIQYKLILTALGSAVGYYIGSQIGTTEEERKKNALNAALLGGAITFASTFLESKDTVNYIGLGKNGQRLYDGICKEGRLEKRMSEHQSNGKHFHKVIVNQPKTRTDARNLERYRIRRFQGNLNIQHNS